jgi:hypothetical protein
LARAVPSGPGLFAPRLRRAHRWARSAVARAFTGWVDANPEEPRVGAWQRRFTAAARCSARRLAGPSLGRRGPRLIERVTARKCVLVARGTAWIDVFAWGLCAGGSVIRCKNGAENPKH